MDTGDYWIALHRHVCQISKDCSAASARVRGLEDVQRHTEVGGRMQQEQDTAMAPRAGSGRSREARAKREPTHGHPAGSSGSWTWMDGIFGSRRGKGTADGEVGEDDRDCNDAKRRVTVEELQRAAAMEPGRRQQSVQLPLPGHVGDASPSSQGAAHSWFVAAGRHPGHETGAATRGLHSGS